MRPRALMAGSMLVGLAGPVLAQDTTRYTYAALGRLTPAIGNSGCSGMGKGGRPEKSLSTVGRLILMRGVND